MQNKRTHMHMHGQTKAQNHKDTLASWYSPTQIKHYNDPRSGRWQTQALKVITEINELSLLRRSDAHRTKMPMKKDIHYEAVDMQMSLQGGTKQSLERRKRG